MLKSCGYINYTKNCDCSSFIVNKFEKCLLDYEIKKRDFYFVGFSVTRHYSYALRKILKNISVPNTREDEKKLQNEHKPPDSNIFFDWKLTIGMDKDNRDPRDNCKHYADTKECFSHKFIRSNTKSVLILQSVAINTTHWNTNKYHTITKGDVFYPYMADSSYHNNMGEIINTIQNTFRGQILWLNYPHVIQRLHNGKKYYFLESCTRYLDSNVMCSLINNKWDRIHYMDFYNLQTQFEDEYDDMIHHPGALSEKIVNTILCRIKNTF